MPILTGDRHCHKAQRIEYGQGGQQTCRKVQRRVFSPEKKRLLQEASAEHIAVLHMYFRDDSGSRLLASGMNW